MVWLHMANGMATYGQWCGYIWPMVWLHMANGMATYIDYIMHHSLMLADKDDKGNILEANDLDILTPFPPLRPHPRPAS